MSKMRSTKGFVFLPLVVMCCSFVTNFELASSLSIPVERDNLRLRILEFDNVSGKLVQVLTSRNSDIIYGEDVGKTSVIVLECRSGYGPVTLSYKGDGAPAFTTNTNTTRTSHGLYFWSFLSFERPLSAEDSGNFTCISPNNDPGILNSVYLYVPDSSRAVFVPSRLAQRLEYPKANYFRIPCSVVHPGARVTLEKLSKTSYDDNEASSQITYSPKSGFYIPISMVNSEGSTTFVCKASFRGKEDEAEYKIFSQEPSSNFESDAEQIFPPTPTLSTPNNIRPSSGLRSACTSSTCGKFAECIVIDYAAHCVCYENHTGDPWKMCNKISEHFQQYAQEDPCSPNPCGRNNPCIPVNGHPVCTCQGNHQGSPTICQPAASQARPTTASPHCTNNNDCAWDAYCNQRTGLCENVCSNNSTPFCAQNSECHSLNHSPVCKCLPGFNGNPYFSKNSQGCLSAFGQPNKHQPNCSPSLCGLNAHCKIDRHSLRAVCVCPKGFTGNAYRACSQVKHRPEPVRQPEIINNHTTTNDVDLQKHLCNRTRCGFGAKCRIRGLDVQCFCPSGTQGNPNIRCDPHTDKIDAVKACDGCGPNSVCTVTGRKVFCECSQNATGIPPNCIHEKRGGASGFCRDNFDCAEDNVCDRRKCVNPCSWMCSETANCAVLNHIVKCTCPLGYEGDPKFGCQRLAVPDNEPEHPCKLNCGRNTVCRAVMFNELEEYRNTLRQNRQEALYFDMIRANGNLQANGVFSECLCRKGYQGNPYSLSGCNPRGDDEGAEHPVIVMETNPCDPTPCGSNSFCRSYNGKAFCSCDFDSTGQPPKCKHRCKADSHCMFNESCIDGLCHHASAVKRPL